MQILMKLINVISDVYFDSSVDLIVFVTLFTFFYNVHDVSDWTECGACSKVYFTNLW